MKQKLTLTLEITYEDEQATAANIAEEVGQIQFEYPITSVKITDIAVGDRNIPTKG